MEKRDWAEAEERGWLALSQRLEVSQINILTISSLISGAVEAEDDWGSWEYYNESDSGACSPEPDILANYTPWNANSVYFWELF